VTICVVAWANNAPVTRFAAWTTLPKVAAPRAYTPRTRIHPQDIACDRSRQADTRRRAHVKGVTRASGWAARTTTACLRATLHRGLTCGPTLFPTISRDSDPLSVLNRRYTRADTRRSAAATRGSMEKNGLRLLSEHLFHTVVGRTVVQHTRACRERFTPTRTRAHATRTHATYTPSPIDHVITRWAWRRGKFSLRTFPVKRRTTLRLRTRRRA